MPTSSPNIVPPAPGPQAEPDHDAAASARTALAAALADLRRLCPVGPYADAARAIAIDADGTDDVGVLHDLADEAARLRAEAEHGDDDEQRRWVRP